MPADPRRRQPAYRREPVPDEWADNAFVAKWWQPAYDAVIADVIERWQWVWFLEVGEALQAVIPEETLVAWRERDPLCQQYAWYNVLAGFAQARAQRLGFTKRIRSPKRRNCAVCGQPFAEESLPFPFVARLGIDCLDVCAPCMEAAIYYPGNERVLKQDMLLYVQELADIIGRVPHQGFGEKVGDLRGLDTETRAKVLIHLRSKPTMKLVKRRFGTWFDALVAAGVLDDGARRDSRGVQCRAADGHLCRSLGEKTIDDLLYQMGVEHEREPGYPGSNYRADFKVGETLIEYFGLIEDPAYRSKTEVKIKLARKAGIPLICIYPKDLASAKRLRGKLAPAVALPKNRTARDVEPRRGG